MIRMTTPNKRIVKTIEYLLSVIGEEIPRSKSLDLRESICKERENGDTRDGKLICALLQADATLTSLEVDELETIEAGKATK